MTVANSGMTLVQDMDTDANWTGEDGISTEEFQQGVASQQWIVAKSGDETAVFTLAVNMTGSKYIILPIISTISPFYTLLSVDLKDGTLNELFTIADQLGGDLHRAVAGQWKFNSHCLQFGNNGGSLTLANFAGLDVRCDNSNSGNIRSVLNTYMDAIYHGTGRTISGTTVGDKLFSESNDLDISADVYDGCTLEFEGEIFAQTDITVDTTTGNSYGETLVFRDVPNNDGLYTLDVTGTAHFKNTIKASGAARVSLDFSNTTALTHEAAAVTRGNVLTYLAAQTVNGVVYTDCLSLVIPNSPVACTYTSCGNITLTGTLSAATINTPALAVDESAITSSDLADVGDTDFTRGANGHAVELTVAAGTMNWSGTLSGYAVGTAGDGVQGTAADAAIYVTGTGTLTINVAAGATVPSVRSTTATVNVVSEFVLTIEGIPSGARLTIANSSTRTVLHDEVSTGVDITYTHAGGETVDLLVIDDTIDPNLSDVYDRLLPTADSTITIRTFTDDNFSNP